VKNFDGVFSFQGEKTANGKRMDQSFNSLYTITPLIILKTSYFLKYNSYCLTKHFQLRKKTLISTC